MLACSHESKIITGDMVAHSIQIPTNVPLWYSFSMAINLSTTIRLQAWSTFLPHSLRLWYICNTKNDLFSWVQINAGDVVAHSIWIPTNVPLTVIFLFKDNSATERRARPLKKIQMLSTETKKTCICTVKACIVQVKDTKSTEPVSFVQPVQML